MGRRARTWDELLTAWRAQAAASDAAADARAESEAAAALDDADPLRATPLTPDGLLCLWARDALSVHLRPGDGVPPAIRVAFARAQASLWDGEPIPAVATLVDDPGAGEPTSR